MTRQEQTNPGVLVQRSRDGDQQAWNDLVDTYGGLVWSVIRSFRLSSADCHDAFQTVWLRLVEHLDSIKNPDAVGGWLATTARRECLTIIRKQSRTVVVDAVDLDGQDDAPPVDAALLDGERDRALHRAFARLGERCQRLLRLLTADPPPGYDVISEAMDMPVGSIGPTRARCLEALRRKVGDDVIAPA